MSRRLLFMTLLALLCLPSAAFAKKPDRDRDGLPDRWERKHRVSSAAADPDDDGLSNWGEFRSRTHPNRYDSDRDGVRDGREDRDRDEVANEAELLGDTDPAEKDSDGDRRGDGREDPDRDGVSNGWESRLYFHPRDADSDGDEIADGAENAGVVRSVDGAAVTVSLATGGVLTGVLSELAFVDCAYLEYALDDEDAALEEDDDSIEDDEDWPDEDESEEAVASQLGAAEDDDCSASLEVGAVVTEAEMAGPVIEVLVLGFEE